MLTVCTDCVQDVLIVLIVAILCHTVYVGSATLRFTRLECTGLRYATLRDVCYATLYKVRVYCATLRYVGSATLYKVRVCCATLRFTWLWYTALRFALRG